MTTQSHFDVVIVGASIAGCTAATFFAQRGLQVALVERLATANAYKKLCTHFIQASATPTIERLGLNEAIEAAGGLRNSMEIWTPWGWIRPPQQKAKGHPTYGYNIRREKLDPLLRHHAAQTPGVQLLLGQTAQRLLTTQGRFTGVEIAGNGQTHQLNASLIVGADGRDSSIAKLAGVQTQTKPNNRFCYFAYYRNLPLTSAKNSQVWLLDPDGAYAFANDDGVTVLVCMLTKDKLATFKQDIPRNFVQFIKNLPQAPDVEGAELISKFMGMLEVPNLSRPVAQPGLALVGDAALAADPLWGVGCGWAFQSAEWLVDCTADTLLTHGNLDRALKQYQRQHHQALSGHNWMIADYSTGRGFNAIEQLIYSAATKDPALAAHVEAFASRSIRVWQFLSPLAILRALWVNATQRKSSGSTPLGVTQSST